jgi:ribosome-binding factor A
MSNRIKKINELIRELVAESLAENISRSYLFTVKAVETERDLKHAVVWVSVLGDEEGFLAELKEHQKEIRHYVTGKMVSKYTPLIEFKIDRSEEYVQHIEELLREK